MQKPLYCPCIGKGDEALAQGKALYEQARDLTEFIRLMNENRVKGKWLAYDADSRTLTIAKRYGCECDQEGADCGACTPSGKCHCDAVRHMRAHIPPAHCQCGAEYYRPLFEGIFGTSLTLYPHETVLSGGERCVIAIELPEGFKKG